MSADRLEGAEIAVTGRFASMSLLEVGNAIRKSGGRLVRTPTPRTQFLIVGQGELPLGSDGNPAEILNDAERLRASGCQLKIVSEEHFLKQLGLADCDDQIRRRHTVIELARILQLPGERIRRWLKQGLIEPAELVNGVALFDFQQVAAARTLGELIDSGLPPAEIRKGLERLRRIFPDAASPLSRISAIESPSRLLHRLENGTLAETTGQLQFDFADQPADEEHLTYVAVARTTDELFEDAVALEMSGQYSQAAATYRMALAKQADDPVIRFNLGNVLFQLGMKEAAAVEYRHAVRVDPSYVEAWNNLGSMLFELGQPDESVAAFQRALRLAPDYPEARFNLGRVHEMQREEAKTTNRPMRAPSV